MTLPALPSRLASRVLTFGRPKYGDIILQAESTTFCVNRDVLMEKSELSDSAKDVKLLVAFYDSFNECLPIPLDELSCKLRLGHKYKARKFEKQALDSDCLKSQFPRDLPTLDKMKNKPGWRWIADEPGVHVDLLNLAYENALHTCIPMMAFHCLSLYSLLFSGIKRIDGSRAMLPEQTKSTLALAIEAMLFQRDNMKWLRKKGTIPVRGCHDPESCEQERKYMCLTESTINSPGDRVNVSYMLEAWGNLEADGLDDAWGSGLCIRCAKVAQIEYNASRVRFWEKLPTFFGQSEQNLQYAE